MASATTPPLSPPGGPGESPAARSTPQHTRGSHRARRCRQRSETLPLCLSFVRWLGCFARSSVCGRGEGGRHGTRDWWRCFRQAGLLVRHRKSIHSLGAGIGLQFSQRGLIEAKIEERLRRVESPEPFFSVRPTKDRFHPQPWSQLAASCSGSRARRRDPWVH